MFEKLTLKAVRKRHKIRRRLRDLFRAVQHWTYPISDDFDRAPLSREALTRIIPTQPAHPEKDAPVAVYSTYCGPTRSFSFDINNQARDYPHYFVSNNHRALRIAEGFGWLPIFLDVPLSKNPVLGAHQSKIAKALPHLFPDLARHRFLVYSDDKQRIHHTEIPGFIDRLTAANGAMALKLSPHVKENILWEFTDSLFQDRYRLQAHRMLKFTLAQIDAGKRLETDRMFMTGYSIRDMNHPDAAALNEAWYDDILACGIDCQLAFDFLAQDNPLIVDLPAPDRKKYLGKSLDKADDQNQTRRLSS